MEDMGEIGLGWVAKTPRYRENKSLVSSLLPVRYVMPFPLEGTDHIPKGRE